MPTYDYACRLCDHEFEAFHSIKDEPLTQCPSCGKKGLRRLIGTGAGIIFKGSGFYETDYKRSSGSATSGDSGSESTTSDKSKTSDSGSTKSSSSDSSSASKSDT